MQTRWRYVLGACLAGLVLTVGIAACGGGDDEGGGGEKTGGTINILGSSYPDYLDPGLSYTVDGWESLSQVYPGLMTYPHEGGKKGAEVVPGLAKAQPEISNGGKTYVFTLRDDLKFSDGKAIKASDFKCSIERELAQDSQGAGFWTTFAPIKGAADFLKTKKGGIPGIEADDASGEVTVTLDAPSAVFLYQLGTPFGGVVPCGTPAKNLTKDPPPGAGRYMYADVKVNRSYSLVKNPNFSPGLKGTAVDAGKASRFNLTIEREVGNQVTKVSQNKADFMIDNPPPDRIPEVKSKYSDRYDQFPTNSTFYFFLNTEAPPFDKLEVRQAVNYAIDFNAVNRVQGGVLSDTNNILPPGVPGYEKSPDLYPFDLQKAKDLIEQAGAKGAKVTVWGNPEDPTKQTIEYYTDVLNKIGLDAKTKIVSAETYFATIGDRSVKAQTGWANWFQDYPHPADFINVLLNPDAIQPTGNNNYSYNAKDKQLASRINAANEEPQLTDAVKQQWADLDVEIQKKAYWAIYGNRKQSTFFSTRMNFEDCKGEHAVWTHDWAEFCLAG